ncbi:MAG: HupE/UreJ family protein [Pseudomonadota bacterium]|nr:HupE/UreJ family protein [Pseudomonadota bacterium]
MAFIRIPPRSLPMLVCLAALPVLAGAHGVSGEDAGFVASVQGVHPGPFAYLGAKHMVTGYDHLAFLAGVIFLLYRLRDVALYATLFALGHSITLLGAVLAGWRVDAHLVDAVIGLSVVYKALENTGGLRSLGWNLDPRAAVLAFGLVHGLGLATKVQDLRPSADGLAANLVAFNVGVELGQIAALSVMVLLFSLWRRTAGFPRAVLPANALLMGVGLLLSGYQLAGYLLAK